MKKVKLMMMTLMMCLMTMVSFGQTSKDKISEGTNSVGIVRWIWAFAYVLLSAALLSEK